MASLVEREGWVERVDVPPGAIVTLIGPPGIGKSALVAEWASDLDARREARGETPSAKDVLILDDADRDLAQAVARAQAADGGVLASSHVPLDIPGEVVLRVPALTEPGARQLLTALAPNPHAAPLDALLAELDGNPAAVGWAASRLRWMSATQLVDWIRRHQREGRIDDLPPHVAAMERCAAVMDPTTRQRFFHLCCFDGDVVLTDVASRLGLGLGDAEALIHDLHRRSLLHVQTGEVVTLRLLRAARWWGRTQLDAERWHRHASWLIGVGHRATGALWSEDRAAAHRLLARHWPDLRACWPFIGAEDRARALRAWRRDLPRSVGADEALEMARSCADASLPKDLEVEICGIASVHCRHLDRKEEALVWADRGVAASRELTPELQARALTSRGDVHLWAHNLDHAVDDLERALQVAPEGRSVTALVWRKLAGVLFMQGDPRAAAHARRAAEIAAVAGNLVEEVTALCHAALYVEHGNVDSERGLGRALKLAAGSPSKILRYLVLANAVHYHARVGDLEAGRAAFAQVVEAPEAVRSRVLGPTLWVTGASLHLMDLEEDEAHWLERVDPLRRDGGARYLLVGLDLVRCWRALMRERLFEAQRLLEALDRRDLREDERVAVALLEAITVAMQGDEEGARARLPPPDASEPVVGIVRAAVLGAPAPTAGLRPGSLHRDRMIAGAAERLTRRAGWVEIAADASWIRADGEEVSLARRPTQRRVLHALVSALEADQVIDPDALFSAGWPGEKAMHRSARQRLWATIRLLRGYGLADVLCTVEGGYRLDASRVRIVAPTAEAG